MFSARPVTQEDREAAAAKATKQRKTPCIDASCMFLYRSESYERCGLQLHGFYMGFTCAGHFLRKKNWQKR